ncbi:histone deacetylase [Flexivirga caeni]|uniref:Histone deacetylase n=1 Tax=Flexivirga caeni TaxID=2294115 RepID=A0A3M9MCF4_9MICO|nr:histone deacetylase [Flexivirga caeni]RNI23250.1 histone deacetylase [Flexivirga caeni]
MHSPVWYAAYGSNLCAERFACYLAGGRPEGASRTYTGCRDTSAPTGIRPVLLPGSVFFGGVSRVWGGGMAFYDPALPGPAYAAAYRIKAEQFADVWCQERHQPVGALLPLDTIVAEGDWRAGEGRYDRVLVVGFINREPVLTFTFGGLRPPANPPAPAYAAMIARGLSHAYGLGPGAAVTRQRARR